MLIINTYISWLRHIWWKKIFDIQMIKGNLHSYETFFSPYVLLQNISTEAHIISLFYY